VLLLQLLKSVELGKLEVPTEDLRQMEEDPVYRVLANVGVMHHKAKSEVKRLKGELAGDRFREAALVSDAFFLESRRTSGGTCEGTNGIKLDLKRAPSGVTRSKRGGVAGGPRG
jgi:hypothetical protein